jgi:hypothetical protein
MALPVQVGAVGTTEDLTVSWHDLKELELEVHSLPEGYAPGSSKLGPLPPDDASREQLWEYVRRARNSIRGLEGEVEVYKRWIDRSKFVWDCFDRYYELKIKLLDGLAIEEGTHVAKGQMLKKLASIRKVLDARVEAIKIVHKSRLVRQQPDV